MIDVRENIKTHADWIIKAFAGDNYQLDYTTGSFIEIDKFFETHSRNGKVLKNGPLYKNTGVIIFGIGAYVGETMINNIPGAKWVIDESDPQAEINASIEFPDGTIAWPMQRVIKRFQNGLEDSVYVYGHHLVSPYLNESFDNSFWNIKQNKNPWWKFR